MKKTIISVLLVMVLVSSVFGASYSPDSTAYKLVGQAYSSTSTRLTGMGGAGLGVEEYADSFLVNPANLGRGKFSISLPTVTVTMFNPKKLLDGNFFPDLKTYMNSKNNSDLIAVATDLLSTLSKGQNEVERVDAGFHFTAGPVGFAVQAQERMFGYLDGSDFTSGKYIAEVTAAATLGLGFRIPVGRTDDWSFDIGASAQFIYKMYTESITSNEVLGIIDKSVDFMNDIRLMSGYAIPITVGVNANMPFGFKVSAVGRNINGKYKYTINDSVNNWKNNFSFGGIFSSKTDFTYDEGFSLDGGVTWKAPVGDFGKWIAPTLSVDVLDILHINSDMPFLAHLYAGAQVRLLSFLDVRYGVAQGYQSVGVGLDLLIFHIDASYWRASYGAKYLDKSIDAFSLRFTIGTK
jgi:hypothetical protein